MGNQIARDQEQLKNLNCNCCELSSNLVNEKELKKLYKNFSKIDKDKSGTLEPEEFFDIPGKITDIISDLSDKFTIFDILITILRVGTEPLGEESHLSAR